jgi:hypothetical protein
MHAITVAESSKGKAVWRLRGGAVSRAAGDMIVNGKRNSTTPPPGSSLLSNTFKLTDSKEKLSRSN